MHRRAAPSAHRRSLSSVLRNSAVAALALVLPVAIATPAHAYVPPPPVAVKTIIVGPTLSSSDASLDQLFVYGGPGARSLYLSARTTTIKVASERFLPDENGEAYYICDAKDAHGASILTAPANGDAGIASGVARLSVKPGSVSVLNNRSYTVQCFFSRFQTATELRWNLTTKLSVGSVISVGTDPTKQISESEVWHWWGTEADDAAVTPGGRVLLDSRTDDFWRSTGTTSKATVRLSPENGAYSSGTSVGISQDGAVLGFNAPGGFVGTVPYLAASQWVVDPGSATTPVKTKRVEYKGQFDVAGP